MCYLCAICVLSVCYLRIALSSDSQSYLDSYLDSYLSRECNREIALGRGAMGLPVDPSSWVLVTSEAGDHTDPEPWEKGGWGDSGGEDGEPPPMELASDGSRTACPSSSRWTEAWGGGWSPCSHASRLRWTCPASRPRRT